VSIQPEAGKDHISEYVVRARSEERGNRRNSSSYNTDEEHKKVQLLHLREKLYACTLLFTIILNIITLTIIIDNLCLYNLILKKYSVYLFLII